MRTILVSELGASTSPNTRELEDVKLGPQPCVQNSVLTAFSLVFSFTFDDHVVATGCSRSLSGQMSRVTTNNHLWLYEVE